MKTFLLLLLAMPVFGQDESITLSDWHIKTGDDARWASPDFNDSGWERGEFPTFRRNRDNRFEVQPHDLMWLRASISPPQWAAGRELAVGIGPVGAVYSVFVNGIEIGRHGTILEGGAGAIGVPVRHNSYVIPNNARRGEKLIIAIRMLPIRGNASPQTWASVIGLHPPIVGLAAFITEGERLHRAEGVLFIFPSNVLWMLIGGCGLFCLALFRRRPAETELLWLGLAISFNAGARLANIPMALLLVATNSMWAFALMWLPYFSVHFFYCLLLAELIPAAKRVIRIAALPIAFASFLIGVHGYFPLPGSPALLASVVDGGLLIQAGLGIIAGLYNLRNRRLDLAALGLGVGLRAFTTFSSNLGNSTVTLMEGFVIQNTAIANALVVASMVYIVYRRYQRRSKQQREAERDMEAAARVQAALLGADNVGDTDFAVETAYLPARQVGGDFYYFSPSPADGSLLVVVGDVSGKGFQAAMLVASTIGSLRNEDSRAPGEVLARLNRALEGRTSGGFITCCCARFDRDGAVTIANAGHLAPYCDECEIEVESGLPLGVVADVQYVETIARGSRFTLLSDGVIEAANDAGELFGFERSRAMSAKSAAAIAEAARAWGQNDDITVVTVRRLG